MLRKGRQSRKFQGKNLRLEYSFCWACRAETRRLICSAVSVMMKLSSLWPDVKRHKHLSNCSFSLWRIFYHLCILFVIIQSAWPLEWCKWFLLSGDLMTASAAPWRLSCLKVCLKKYICSFKYSDLLKMMREILESRSSEPLLIKFKSEVSDGPQRTLRLEPPFCTLTWCNHLTGSWSLDSRCCNIPAVCPGGWTL